MSILAMKHDAAVRVLEVPIVLFYFCQWNELFSLTVFALSEQKHCHFLNKQKLIFFLVA
jgi:hypothetical protein